MPGLLDGDVDCSWNEQLPLCPMIHWAFEACEVRSKRDTDGQDDITMDAAEDMVSLVKHTKTVYSVQTSIKRSPLRQRTSVLIRQMTS